MRTSLTFRGMIALSMATFAASQALADDSGDGSAGSSDPFVAGSAELSEAGVESVAVGQIVVGSAAVAGAIAAIPLSGRAGAPLSEAGIGSLDGGANLWSDANPLPVDDALIVRPAPQPAPVVPRDPADDVEDET